MNVFPPITHESVLKLIRNMKKSFCLNDPIDIRKVDLENCGAGLAKIYVKLINLSFKSGVFPEAEKFAYVKPLIKKGNDPDELSSYRPLYQTSFLSKLIERAILVNIFRKARGREEDGGGGGVVLRGQNACQKIKNCIKVMHSIKFF